MRGNLFYFDLSNETCFIAQHEDIWLWHKRLCHVNFDNFLSFSKMKRVRGFPKLKKSKNAMWKQCQLGKMTKSSFKSKSYSSNEILELFHIDLCGPIGVQSYFGDTFFILCVDDCSRMITMMFLEETFDDFQLFKWYFAIVESYMRKCLKCLRSNRG